MYLSSTQRSSQFLPQDSDLSLPSLSPPGVFKELACTDHLTIVTAITMHKET
jgi:hypothetical protein